MLTLMQFQSICVREQSVQQLNAVVFSVASQRQLHASTHGRVVRQPASGNEQLINRDMPQSQGHDALAAARLFQ